VPERREERTTEGGLDVAGATAALKPYVGRLVEAGIQVSLFIAPDPVQIAAAASVGAPAIEFHTGHWADFIAAGRTAEAEAEFARVIAGARQARGLGIEVHAGHGLDYATSETIAAVPEIVELNTGHFIIGEAVFESLASVIRAMRQAMGRARAVAPGEAA
jgi:pyridoxine 5-phosphate synthase